jgi:hypothetical protein
MMGAPVTDCTSSKVLSSMIVFFCSRGASVFHARVPVAAHVAEPSIHRSGLRGGRAAAEIGSMDVLNHTRRAGAAPGRHSVTTPSFLSAAAAGAAENIHRR